VSEEATKLPESSGATIGPYEIVSVLRRGPSATIYLGKSPRGHDVVLEVAADTTRNSPDDRRSQNVSAATRLVHRHIERVLDAGTDSGLSYVVTERLRGRRLREWMDDPATRPDTATRIDLVAQLCIGLHFAHEHGVVHGNVTPENVFVTDDGIVKILNFGAASRDRATVAATAPATNPPYLAPEQLGGKAVVDGRSDVFSAGAILYELVTGRTHPTRGITADDLALIGREATIPVAELTKLELAVRRSLDPDPSKRYGSAQEFAYALWTLHLPTSNRDAEDIEQPSETLYVDRSTDHPEATAVESGAVKREPSRQPLILATIAAVIMIGIAVGLMSC
jgi:eukaryotic-like serine/threonine-protein kinase